MHILLIYREKEVKEMHTKTVQINYESNREYILFSKKSCYTICIFSSKKETFQWFFGYWLVEWSGFDNTNILQEHFIQPCVLGK